MRRRPAVTLALAIAMGVTALGACTPTGPNADVGEVIDLRDDDFAIVLEDADEIDLTIPVPESVWTVGDVAVVDELEVLGNRLVVPEGSAFVVLGGVTGFEGGEQETTFAVVSRRDGVPVELDGPTAVVVPDGGEDSRLVATYDGREVGYDLVTGALLDGFEDPYLQATETVRIDDWTLDVSGLPDGVELNDVAPFPLTLTLTLSTYLPELGWATNGGAWLTVEGGVAEVTGFDVEGYPDGAGSAAISLDRVEVAGGSFTAEFVQIADEPLGPADSVRVSHNGADEPIDAAVTARLEIYGGLAPDGSPTQVTDPAPFEEFTATLVGTADVELARDV